MALGLLLSLLLLEALLCWTPELVSRGLLNLAYGRYDTHPGGIYVREPLTRMQFLRPNLETRAYSNGYFWTHRTDSLGFRNPRRPISGRVLLLGDSMIYGHGVESDQTTGHFLRTLHGRDVYNLSRQADCLYNHYVNYRLFGDRFRAETIVLFFLLNDFYDLAKRRTPDEILDAPDVHSYDYSRIRRSLGNIYTQWASLPYRLLFRLNGVRMLRNLGDELVAQSDFQIFRRPVDPGGPPFVRPILDPERFEPLAHYYRRVLGDLAARSHDRGSRLVMVNLNAKRHRAPFVRQAQDKTTAFLETLGKEIGIPVYSTMQALGGCSDCYLENDGHFNEEGHRQLAAFLHRQVL